MANAINVGTLKRIVAKEIKMSPDEVKLLPCPWGCKSNYILKDGGIDDPNQLRVWGCPHANGMRLEVWNDNRTTPINGIVKGGI